MARGELSTGVGAACRAAVLCLAAGALCPSWAQAGDARSSKPGRWEALSAEGRAELMASARPLPLRDRLVRLSEPFLGTRYGVSPLGEGAGVDADPLIRFDRVDCLTVVEETIALALAEKPEALVEALNRIRYAAGAQTYDQRNHLMEAQWLPNNEAKGLLRKVTRAYAGNSARTVEKVLSARTWAEKGGTALALSEVARPLGRFELEIVPVEEVEATLGTVPSGTLVVVVRADRPWLVTRVTHVAILVQTSDGPMLRHASRTFGRVVDEPVARYLKRNLDYGVWTVEGVALYEVLDPTR